VIELENDRISLAAVDTGMACQVVRYMLLGPALSTSAGRGDLSDVQLPAFAKILAEARFAPVLVVAAGPGEVTQLQEPPAPPAALHRNVCSRGSRMDLIKGARRAGLLG
jgi:hypothetical protein